MDPRTNEPSDGGTRPIHAIVSERAAAHPAATALIFEGRTMTYGELDRRANQVAHWLRARGAGPDVVIGVCSERSFELVIGILGILKAGAAYVPLDPELPADRLHHMVTDADARIVVTDRARPRELVGGAEVTLDLTAAARELETLAETAPDVIVRDGNLIYVLYTSGSTGRPKGVMMTHGALRNVLQWQIGALEIGAQDTLVQRTTISFDGSAEELFVPLMVGGRLVLARPGGHRDPDHILELVREYQVGVLHLVPSMLRALLDAGGLERATALRHITVGAEALEPALCNRVTSQLRSAFHNHYGPTETAIKVTAWTCPRTSVEQVSIGAPVANTQVHLLDPATLAEVGPGQEGELCIAGAQLARGYHGKPGLTAEKFIPSPFRAGERLYRTGDRARRRADGNLEFLGRFDTQVKIRGFRIEVGEVQAVLAEHPHVKEVVVLAEQEHGKEPRLLAYVVPVAGTELSVDELRAHAERRLASYMMPSAIVPLAALPLTASGKLDRTALPVPRRILAREELVGARPLVALRTELHARIAGVWKEVLAVDPIGADDGFLDLGGDSLRAVSATLRLREQLGIEIPMRLMIQNATVAQLATAIEERRAAPATARRGGATSRAPAIRTGSFPATRTQRRFWMEWRAGFSNTIPFLLELSGPVNVRALRMGLDALVKRHPSLRTSFELSEGDVFQVITMPKPAAFEHVELSDVPEGDRAARAQQLVAERARSTFDLATGSLSRTHLISLSDDHHFLLWHLHHIVGDFSSMMILYKELATLYAGFVSERPATLPALVADATDVARWEREQSFADHLVYWRNALDPKAPPLDLGVGRPRPAQQTRGSCLSWRAGPNVSAGLRSLARAEGATFNMAVMSGIFALLHRYSGLTDLVVGVPVSMRDRLELESVVGCFVNQVPVRVRFASDASFRDLLRNVRAAALDAYAHQQVPFERIVEELAPPRSAGHNPLYQVLSELARDEPLQLPGVTVTTPVQPVPPGARLDLAFVLSENDDAVWGEIRYSEDLFDADIMAALGEHFATLLESAVASPDAPLGDLALLRGD